MVVVDVVVDVVLVVVDVVLVVVDVVLVVLVDVGRVVVVVGVVDVAELDTDDGASEAPGGDDGSLDPVVDSTVTGSTSSSPADGSVAEQPDRTKTAAPSAAIRRVAISCRR